MRLLVATNETLGQRANDFQYVPEGEPVLPSFECDGEAVDGRCGCRRALTGLVTATGGTIFKVIEAETDRATFERRVRESLVERGWIPSATATSEDDALVAELVDAVETVAAHFPLGSIIERRGDEYRRRA